MALRKVPIALPIVIKLWLKFYGGGLEAKMVLPAKLPGGVCLCFYSCC